MKKKITIVVLIILILLASLFLINNFTAKKNEGFKDASEIPEIPKKYLSNEYFNLNISNQELSLIYFNDYVSILSTNLPLAYSLLDEDYRNNKFPTYNSFVEYINNFYITISTMNEYRVVNNKYYVYDKNNNEFIFVTNGVMNYKVYLDSTTVDITNFE